jgi:hypothetical protein
MEEPKPPATWTEMPPAQQPREETPHWLTEEPPWWLANAPTYSEPAAMPQPAPRVGRWHSVAAHEGQKPAVAKVREEVKAPDEIPTRLSGLRGLNFSLGVKELSPKKGAERDGNGNGAPADAARIDPEQTIVVEASVPRPGAEPTEAKAEANAEESIARKEVPRWVTAEPEFLPPPAGEADKGKEFRWNRGNYDPEGPDGIQILPSRRGQYKR